MNDKKVRHEALTYAGKEGALEPVVSSITRVLVVSEFRWSCWFQPCIVQGMRQACTMSFEA